MSRHIEHQLMAPDGRPLMVLAKEPVRSGETIKAFIRRNGWHFDLPTRCFVNGEVIRPEQLTKIRIRVRDEITIVSRPGNTRSGSASSAKSIGAIVAMVALTVLAPYAGGALAGALGLTGATLAGVAYSSIFSGIILAGGAALLSQFMKPKAASKQSTDTTVYSISASGNQARPLGMIPVGYGQRLRYPDYAAPPYTRFAGEDQFLYQLFCIGCGDYDPKTFLLDDTPWWTEQGGTNPAFVDAQYQWVRPGQDVTLFPVNITSASEVSGQQFPSPSKDTVRNGWLGWFSVNPPATTTTKLIFDLVWPGGAGTTYKGREFAVSVPIRIEGRLIDDAGAPIGGETAAGTVLLAKTYSINSKKAYRITEEVTVPSGRWQVRARRLTDALVDQTLPDTISGRDDVAWTAARAQISGVQRYPGLTMLAVVMKADAQLSGASQNRIGVIAARRLEVYQGGAWVTQATRNPIDAAIDAWRNADYSADLPDTALVLPDLIAQRDAAASRGDTFDHFFEESPSIQDAIDTALRVCRCNGAFIGDRLSISRDEAKVPRMVFTDFEMVRGSLTIKRQLLDDTWADGVVVNYFDERTNRPASAASATGLLRPSTVEISGVSKGDKAKDLARYLAAVNRYRRRMVSFDVELEGRMLKRGDLVLVQSELPQTWGQGGEVRTYLIVNGILQLTLDAPVSFTAGQQHYILLRQRNGRPYGPVLVTTMAGSSAVVALDATDLDRVRIAQGSIYERVLDRRSTEDPPTFSFSIGSPREYRGLVVSATKRDMTATIQTVIEAPQVYAATGSEVPPIPQVPSIFAATNLPVVLRLRSNAYQRGVTLYLQVSWDPVASAAAYVGSVSIDDGTTFVQVYRDTAAQFDVPIANVDKAKFRVACVTASGVVCRAVEGECAIPPLKISGELVDTSDLSPIPWSVLDAEVRGRITDAQAAAKASQDAAADALVQANTRLAWLRRGLAADATLRQGYVDPLIGDAQQNLTIVTQAMLRVQRDVAILGDRMAAAGIEVNSAEGTVRINAVSRLETAVGERITTLGIVVDALKAEIELYGSVQTGDVSGLVQTLSTVQVRLDAAEGTIQSLATKASVDAISSSLTSVQQTLDAQAGLIEQKASQVEVDGQTQRLSTAETRLNAVEGAASTAVTAARLASADIGALPLAFLRGFDGFGQQLGTLSATVARAETNMRANIDEQGRSVAEMDGRLLAFQGETGAQFATVTRAVASASEAIVTQQTLFSAQLGAVTASFAQEVYIRAAADTAQTTRTDGALSRIDNVEAGLTTEQQTRANADNALSSSLTSLTARVGTSESSLTSLGQTVADNQNSTASQFLGVSARFGSVEGRVSTNEGNIQSLFTSTANDRSANATAFQNVNARFGNNESSIASVQQAQSSATAAQANVNTDLYARSDAGTAQGRFYMQAVSAPSGVSVRLAMQASIDSYGQRRNAGLYVDLMPDGTSRILADATTFGITGDGGVTYPFIVSGGYTRIRNLLVEQSAVIPGSLNQSDAGFAPNDTSISFTITVPAGARVAIWASSDGKPGVPLSAQQVGVLRIARGSTALRDRGINYYVIIGNNNPLYYTLNSESFYRDAPPAGTHTYTVSVTNGQKGVSFCYFATNA